MMSAPNPRSPTEFPSVSGIILAGGASRRMGGVNKALLRIRGRSIVERVRDLLAGIFPEVIVITNSPEEFAFLGLPMFSDLMPGKGSLGGLYTGLKACTGTHGFLVGCDMPFLHREVMLHMGRLIGDHDVVIPKIGGHWEPLHAIYSRRCLPVVEEVLDRGELRIFSFFDYVNVCEVPDTDLARFDSRFLFAMNVNTPEDLARARALAEELEPA
ncbi:MAG: molybdenum cofactor guanylyltransferase [Desulfomonile tiedjei]|nr:molybdenum cofactor guanylyltransferase [Desulfomonile tiedjei]